MSVFVKRLGTHIPHMELVFFRSFINFLVVAVAMGIRGENFFPAGKKLLFFRGLMGFCGVTCLFYGVAHLPLSIAAMINWSSPVFVILISRAWLKEKLSVQAMAWIALAFTGLVMLIRPDFGAGRTHLPLHAVIIALMGAFFGGMAYVAVRKATARVGVNPIVLYFTGTATLLSLPWAAQEFRIPDLSVLIELILIGLFASWGQFCMTQGYRFAAAGLVSTMGLLNAVFAVLFGWVFFAEALAAIQWIGMILLGFGIAAASRSRRTRV